MNEHIYGLRTNPPRPTLAESAWRVRSNETPLGPRWSDWAVDLAILRRGLRRRVPPNLNERRNKATT
jgi:hypothetical protein